MCTFQGQSRLDSAKIDTDGGLEDTPRSQKRLQANGGTLKWSQICEERVLDQNRRKEDIENSPKCRGSQGRKEDRTYISSQNQFTILKVPSGVDSKCETSHKLASSVK
ncbi:OLC1v1006160C1 [Oldenlandia corymbosa var. corymbosa]|uniref:OLC1v1006160C1 n=1 Tax=Oldenlandia corymbosa var. corymbosa TaxID=529605 RepID=A0AAV1DGU5_OLDCO|nr:OLC1v1006160C1 [Oldenlandia corymbosa var. corymbosa]